MDYNYIDCDFEKLSANIFVSDKIRINYEHAFASWVTAAYLLFESDKVVAFCLMKDENLSGGFLHYHIPADQRRYFIDTYPLIDQKTNQIFYVYTDNNFCNKGFGTHLLRYVISNQKIKGYRSLWLKRETNSRIYENLSFCDFLEGTKKLLDTEFDDFVKDYEQYIGSENLLLNKFGDQRLVYLLS